MKNQNRMKSKVLKLLSMFLAFLFIISVPLESYAMTERKIIAEDEYLYVREGIEYKISEKLYSNYDVSSKIYQRVGNEFELYDELEYRMDKYGTSYLYSKRKDKTEITTRSEKSATSIGMPSKEGSIMSLNPPWVTVGTEYKHTLYIQSDWTKYMIAVEVVALALNPAITMALGLTVAGVIFDLAIYGTITIGEQVWRDTSVGDGYKNFRIGMRPYNSNGVPDKWSYQDYKR